MSLPDTAEYWWDVKRKSSRMPFVHIKGFDCGHFHVTESKKLKEVDCYACKKEIENNPVLQQRLKEENKFKPYKIR